MTDENPAGRAQGRRRTTEDIAQLFEVARGEQEAIRQLDGCVQRLHQVQAAKAALTALSAVELRAALESRRATLGGETA